MPFFLAAMPARTSRTTRLASSVVSPEPSSSGLISTTSIPTISFCIATPLNSGKTSRGVKPPGSALEAAGAKMLADLSGQLFLLGISDESVLDQAEILARHAISLEPNLQHAHWVTGWLHFLRFRAELCIKELEIVLSLNPNHANLLGATAYLLTMVGQWDQAIPLAHKAMRLNPHHHFRFRAKCIILGTNFRKYSALAELPSDALWKFWLMRVTWKIRKILQLPPNEHIFFLKRLMIVDKIALGILYEYVPGRFNLSLEEDYSKSHGKSAYQRVSVQVRSPTI